MYAIVKTGGKQYRVEQGQRLLVERLPAAEGADVRLQPILYRSEQAVFDRAGLQDVTVTAKVLAHVRGEKLRVFKFKPKRGYKRRNGHRQELTQIEVVEIASGRARATSKPAPAKASPEKAAAGGAKAESREAAKPKAEKPAQARAKAEKPAGGSAKAPKPSAAKAQKAAPGKAKPAKPAKPAGGAAKAQKPRAAKPEGGAKGTRAKGRQEKPDGS